MSAMQAVAAPGHGDAGHERSAHGHPGARFYLAVGVVLAVITALEVWLSYSGLQKTALNVLLLALSAVKFAMVVGFFMHLRFDNRLYFYMFGFGLLIAMGVVTSLFFLLPPSALPLPGVPRPPSEPLNTGAAPGH